MARYLPETIESILSQDYTPIELIVIDAGSTEAPKKFLRISGRLHSVIGPDKGPSDAAQRGFQQAPARSSPGSMRTIRTAGAVRTAVDYLETHPDIDVVYGLKLTGLTEQGQVIRRYPTLPSIRGCSSATASFASRRLSSARLLPPLRARPGRQHLLRLRPVDQHGQTRLSLRVDPIYLAKLADAPRGQDDP
jgi:glycosyltransferase involved in cell wall biosynthesis